MGNCYGRPFRSKKKEKRRAKAEDGGESSLHINLGATSGSSRPIIASGGSSNSLRREADKKEALAIDDFILGLRIGDGTYGQVWEAKSSVPEKTVAIKKVVGAFENVIDSKRIFREVFYLWKMRDHPNIVSLLAVCTVEQDPDSIGLVLEIIATDLMKEIKYGRLNQENKRYITYQLFAAANYLHSANIIYRDYKPENVLLTSDYVVKVCDFGTARSLSMVGMEEVTEEPPVTDTVGTLWYVAPEVLMGSVSYTKAADVWSLGCVVVEMMTGIPLASGCGRHDHLAKILTCLPKPTQEDIDSLRTPCADDIERIANNVSSTYKRVMLSRLMSRYPEDLVDLVARMLKFNPTRRCKMYTALSHPYLARYHDPTQELSPERDVVPPLCDWHTLEIEDYMTEIYKMMAEINKEERWRGPATVETKPSASVAINSLDDNNQDTPPTTDPVLEADAYHW